MKIKKGQTSLTTAPADIDYPPFCSTIPPGADLHLKFVLRDTNSLQTCLKNVVIGGHISQRSDTFKVVQEAEVK